MMDLPTSVGIATLILAVGAILGYAFAAGGKSAAIQLNTKEIGKVAKENDDRYANVVEELKVIRERHFAFEVEVARDYVNKDALLATEKRITSIMEKIADRVDQIMRWTAKSDTDHH